MNFNGLYFYYLFGCRNLLDVIHFLDMVVVERGKRTRESHSPSKSEGNVKVPATTTATMASGTSTSNVKVNFLQNMSNSELNMIHRLAGNDPEARKATIKKLRKWLKAMATKVPDGIRKSDLGINVRCSHLKNTLPSSGSGSCRSQFWENMEGIILLHVDGR